MSLFWNFWLDWFERFFERIRLYQAYGQKQPHFPKNPKNPVEIPVEFPVNMSDKSPKVLKIALKIDSKSLGKLNGPWVLLYNFLESSTPIQNIFSFKNSVSFEKLSVLVTTFRWTMRKLKNNDQNTRTNGFHRRRPLRLGVTHGRSTVLLPTSCRPKLVNQLRPPLCLRLHPELLGLRRRIHNNPVTWRSFASHRVFWPRVVVGRRLERVSERLPRKTTTSDLRLQQQLSQRTHSSNSWKPSSLKFWEISR